MAFNVLVRLAESPATGTGIPPGYSLLNSGGRPERFGRMVNPAEKVDGNLFGHAGFVAGPLQKSLKIGSFADETLAARRRLGTVKC